MKKSENSYEIKKIIDNEKNRKIIETEENHRQ